MRRKNRRQHKLQSAVDFLSSYGMVIVIIITALVAVTVIASKAPVTPGCIAPPGFSCSFVSIGTNGILTVKISQAIGSDIKINGWHARTSRMLPQTPQNMETCRSTR